jgi:hypothetical protein
VPNKLRWCLQLLSVTEVVSTSGSTVPLVSLVPKLAISGTPLVSLVPGAAEKVIGYSGVVGDMSSLVPEVVSVSLVSLVPEVSLVSLMSKVLIVARCPRCLRCSRCLSVPGAESGIGDP